VTDRLIFDVASSLTDRDRQILRLLRWHRVLTTSQVHLMFFNHRNTAQHRMTRLYELRLVERFRPLRDGRDAECHYVLDVLGAYVVVLMAAHDSDREVKVRWRTDQALSIATSQRLAHTVGANDIFVRLVAAARHDPTARLATWWGERYCKAVLGEVVRPDGLGLWQEAGASLTFCLEYDRGSEPLGRLAAKAADYKRLEAAWGVAFWVLVVVPRPWGRPVRRRPSGRHHHPRVRPSADRRRLGAARRRRHPPSPHRPGHLASIRGFGGSSRRGRQAS
jgi:hypothetical protein